MNYSFSLSQTSIVARVHRCSSHLVVVVVTERADCAKRQKKKRYVWTLKRATIKSSSYIRKFLRLVLCALCVCAFRLYTTYKAHALIYILTPIPAFHFQLNKILLFSGIFYSLPSMVFFCSFLWTFFFFLKTRPPSGCKRLASLLLGISIKPRTVKSDLCATSVHNVYVRIWQFKWCGVLSDGDRETTGYTLRII